MDLTKGPTQDKFNGGQNGIWARDIRIQMHHPDHLAMAPSYWNLPEFKGFSKKLGTLRNEDGRNDDGSCKK